MDTYGKCVGVRLGSSGSVGRARRGDVPGQQVRDAVHGVIGDARQDLAQVYFRIESVEFLRADQTVDGGRGLAARVGAGEQVRITVRASTKPSRSPPAATRNARALKASKIDKSHRHRTTKL